MKPCDCRSFEDIRKLEEQGIGFNSRKIAVDSMGVLLTIDPHVTVKFTHKIFKRFVEWYLADQGEVQ